MMIRDSDLLSWITL